MTGSTAGTANDAGAAAKEARIWRILSWGITVAALAACLYYLWWSAVPGALESHALEFFFFGFFAIAYGFPILVGVAIVTVLIAVVWGPWSDARPDEPCPTKPPRVGFKRWIVLAAALATLVLSLTPNPTRWLWAASRNALEARLLDAPAPGLSQPANFHCGWYWIDRWGRDEAGGVYFRMHSGPDGIGPDQMSYGVCWRPGGEETPFGHAGLHLKPLGGDWHEFSVSDD